MSDSSNLPARQQDTTLANITAFEGVLLQVLGSSGLPTDRILVNIDERGTVFRNFEHVLSKIQPEQRARSLYISKFLAAVGVGLIDAALNYLWDGTVNELRLRIEQYDLSYFYDNAGLSEKIRTSAC